MLLRYIEEIAGRSSVGNHSLLHLHVQASNLPAISLYEDEGFERKRVCELSSDERYVKLRREGIKGKKNLKQDFKQYYYYMVKEIDDNGNVTDDDFKQPVIDIKKKVKKFKMHLESERKKRQKKKKTDIDDEDDENDEND